MQQGSFGGHKLLVANRGEIAVRILRTAKRLGLKTLSLYTSSDVLSHHALRADESVLLPSHATAEAAAYLSIPSIISVCTERSVTLVHPGYGFLSENAEFAQTVIDHGMIWLGPRPEIIHRMGIKHEARRIAMGAGVQVVPGSEGLVETELEAVALAERVGFPVMLKATAGGGGMGMVVCEDEETLKNSFKVIEERAQALFHNGGVFLEKYFESARHIEIQIFGNGLGDVIHLLERECSVQRRHQKVIEESPSPFCSSLPGLRERMCDVAVKLGSSIGYNSAGTVEFLVDETTGNFYFLEMNTRIQVEHPVTEAIIRGLDIVELMIRQGLAENSLFKGLTHAELTESALKNVNTDNDSFTETLFAIEGRVYAENPYENFLPCPGLLQEVFFDIPTSDSDSLRVDTWIETGTMISPHFDPLLAKVIVTGASRKEAISRFIGVLDNIRVSGPPNNIQYLRHIAQNEIFASGKATTTFLKNFTFIPNAFKVLLAGLDASIQDFLGRKIGLGVPRSGPMDNISFALGNFLVGNPKTTEGLEVIVAPGISFSLQFLTTSVISITGRRSTVKINGIVMSMWTKLVVPSNGIVTIEAGHSIVVEGGFRNYLCVRGGFPDIPRYLGSKSTSMGLGGYQGRPLTIGDQISLGVCGPSDHEFTSDISIPLNSIPVHPPHWTIYVLSGPHDDEEFVTKEGISRFYSTHWQISPSSNRLGIRLEAPSSSDKINWARSSGGEGGSHPSNILDNGYAPGTININGDTPVILTNEGPNMGGFLCLCTVATAEMWKLGQLAPGDTVQFKRIPWEEACRKESSRQRWLASVEENMFSDGSQIPSYPFDSDYKDTPSSPVLCRLLDDKTELKVMFRQAGDVAILVEFGDMHLDVIVRAKIHIFQEQLKAHQVAGVQQICPCIRSVLCHFDPNVISQTDFLDLLVVCAKSIPVDISDISFPGRRITFPIVLDDKWNREALERYMATIREDAVYLPSNIDYLARNNGLTDGSEALQRLISSDWLVLGVGFYLACPFLVPIDPRCRLIGQKMNPSRTFTPRGSIGIAGPVAAIYPIESPGGYQLFGRTLPGWQTWGKGKDFHADRPWLLNVFDQISFIEVQEEEYLQIEHKFDSGQYEFKIEDVSFSLSEHTQFVEAIKGDLNSFLSRQHVGASREEVREARLLREWEERKVSKVNKAPNFNTMGSTSGVIISSSVFATVWKLKSRPGELITTSSQVLVILEAMKTEIPVLAGFENIGKIVLNIAPGVGEGSSVRPGDALIILE